MTDVTRMLARVLLPLAVLAGLVGMHVLTALPLPVPSAEMHASPAEHQKQSPGEHGHPGPVCESGAVISPLWTHDGAVAVTPVGGALPLSPVSRVEAVTTGSGCDPPDRAQLQVWRT